MDFLGEAHQMTLKSRLFFMLGTFSVGLFLVSGLALAAVYAVKVNGPLYEKIVTGKDLLADVHQPAMGTAEVLLAAQRLADSTDEVEVVQLAKSIREKQAEFDAARAAWEARLPEGETRSRLRAVLTEADGFFAAIEQELVPAAKGGGIMAVQRAMERVQARYDAQSARSREFAAHLAAQQKADEEEGRVIVRNRTILLIVVILLVMIGGGGIALQATQRVGRSIAGLVDQTRRITDAVTGPSGLLETWWRRKASAAAAVRSTSARSCRHALSTAASASGKEISPGRAW